MMKLKSELARVLLYGGACTGKTVSSISALKSPGIERLLFVATENNCIPAIRQALQIHKIKLKPGQLIICLPQSEGTPFGNLLRAMNDFENKSKSQALKGDPTSHMNKSKYNHIKDILESFEDFSGEDFLTGETVKLGAVNKLSQSDVMVVDGLSVLTQEIWNYTRGDKILVSQDDYGPVQQLLMNILMNLSKGCTGHVIMMAHEKELFETVVANGKETQTLVEVRPDTNCGNSNFTRLMGNFTDVIHTTRLGAKFVWETQRAKVYGVARYLPFGQNLEADFSVHDFFKGLPVETGS